MSDVSVRVKKGGPLADSHYVYVVLPPMRTGADGDMTFRSKLFPSKAKANAVAGQIRKASKGMAFNMTDPRWGLRPHGDNPKRYTGHRSRTAGRRANRYIVDSLSTVLRPTEGTGYILRQSDVGQYISDDFDQVKQSDVGRMIWRYKGGAAIVENNAQRAKRQGISPGSKGHQSPTGCACPPKPRRNAVRGGNRAYGVAHKQAWDDAFIAGFKAAIKDLTAGNWYVAQTAFNRRASVRKKYGSDWVEGYGAMQDVKNGAYAHSGPKRAIALGLLPQNYWL